MQSARLVVIYATLAPSGILTMWSSIWKCTSTRSGDISGAHHTSLRVLKRLAPKYAWKNTSFLSKPEARSDFLNMGGCRRQQYSPCMVPNVCKIPRNQKILKYAKLLKNLGWRTSALSKTPPTLPIFRNKCFVGKIELETFFLAFCGSLMDHFWPPND